MNDDLLHELSILISIDCAEVNDEQAFKVKNICSKFLSSDEYNTAIKAALDELVDAPDFNIFSEIYILIKLIIDINQKTTFYKDVKQCQSKYLIWIILYNYLSKYNCDILNNAGLGKLRIMFNNCWALLAIETSSLRVSKITARDKIANCTGWSCCSTGKINV